MITCHWCGCHYILPHTMTWHEMWETMKAAGWAIDEQRRWKCDRCQKEDNDGKL